MKAKTGSRFLNSDRTNLYDVIPLKTPFLIFLDPSSACNLKCPFCPCGGAHKDLWNEDKKQSVMDFEVYKKIIDDLAKFPDKIKTLRLYKEGEPLVNKRLPDMIKYAKDSGRVSRIDFTTNGTLLKPELNLRLIDAGVDRINISIEALNAEEYEKNSGFKLDFDDFLSNLEHLYNNRGNCHIFMKINDFGLKGHTKEEFFDIFGNFCDEISVENVSDVWPGFDVSDYQQEFNKSIYNEELNKVEVCPYIFYSMCVNSDASVSNCFLDWNHDHILGNAYQESLYDIWNSEALRELRIAHLKKNKDNYKTCKNCGQLNFATLDNIDKYADELLKRF